SANEIDLVGLDQLECSRCRLTGIELVVAHNELGLACGILIEPVDCELGAAHLVARLGAVRPADRHRETDLDRHLLRARNVDSERSHRGCGTCSRQQLATAEFYYHWFPPDKANVVFFCSKS